MKAVGITIAKIDQLAGARIPFCSLCVRHFPLNTSDFYVDKTLNEKSNNRFIALVVNNAHRY